MAEARIRLQLCRDAVRIASRGGDGCRRAHTGVFTQTVPVALSPAATHAANSASAPRFEHVAPAPTALYTTPASVIEFVTPADAYSTPAPVFEYVALAPDVFLAVPVPVIEDVTPAPPVSYTAPAPVIGYAKPAVTCATPAPVIDVTPTPVTVYIAPLSAATLSIDTVGFVNPQLSISAVVDETASSAYNQVHQEQIAAEQESVECVQQHTVEQIVHVPTPQIHEQIVESVQVFSRELFPVRIEGSGANYRSRGRARDAGTQFQ